VLQNAQRFIPQAVGSKRKDLPLFQNIIANQIGQDDAILKYFSSSILQNELFQKCNVI
jgi:hypothetical protein